MELPARGDELVGERVDVAEGYLEGDGGVEKVEGWIGWK